MSKYFTRLFKTTWKPTVLGLVASVSMVGSVNASYLEHESVKPFISDMVEKHGFDRQEIEALFAQAEKKQSILDAIARPAEKRLEWKGYRKIFITEDRITRGKAFMAEHADTLARAEKEFGVPKSIIAAIIGVETFYGRII